MIDTDEQTGEQFATATALADITRGQTGPVQLDGKDAPDIACACSVSVGHGARVDLYRPNAVSQWHIAGKMDDPL